MPKQFGGSSPLAFQSFNPSSATKEIVWQDEAQSVRVIKCQEALNEPAYYLVQTAYVSPSLQEFGTPVIWSWSDRAVMHSGKRDALLYAKVTSSYMNHPSPERLSAAVLSSFSIMRHLKSDNMDGYSIEWTGKCCRIARLGTGDLQVWVMDKDDVFHMAKVVDSVGDGVEWIISHISDFDRSALINAGASVRASQAEVMAAMHSIASARILETLNV